MSTHSVVAPSQPGFFGKLPGRGDFVGRGLPQTVVDHWNDWVSRAIESSRQQLGAGWNAHFAAGPMWRFLLQGGLCGPLPVIGVMMPSVDRVQRHYPLLIAAVLDADADLDRIALHDAEWFQRTERLALTTLADDIDLQHFAAQVNRLGLPSNAMPRLKSQAETDCMVCALDDVDHITPALTAMLRHAPPSIPAGHSLWWTSGARQMDGCLSLCNGMPDPRRFAAMLVGRWQQWGWHIAGA